MNNIKQNESGRTMLEMLGVLSIMGIIMYGAISGIGFGVSMYKINATYNQLEEISQGLTDLYSWSRSYLEGSEMTTAVCENAVTECNTANKIVGEYGDIIIGKENNGANYTLTINGLTELACGRLKTMSYANMTVDGGCDLGNEDTLILLSR